MGAGDEALVKAGIKGCFACLAASKQRDAIGSPGGGGGCLFIDQDELASHLMAENLARMATGVKELFGRAALS